MGSPATPAAGDFELHFVAVDLQRDGAFQDLQLAFFGHGATDQAVHEIDGECLIARLIGCFGVVHEAGGVNHGG